MKRRIITICTILVVTNGFAQVLIEPGNGRVNVKGSGGDVWGNYGTTTNTRTAMVFRTGVSSVSNWQNTGSISGVLGSYPEINAGMYLDSYAGNLSLYGINQFRLGTNANRNRMVMNTDGAVGINYTTKDKYNFDPIADPTITKAQLWVTGSGPAQYVYGDYYTLSERMGIKAVAAPTNGTNTTAVVGISDYHTSLSSSDDAGQTTGVTGFSASKTNAYGVKGIADGYGSGSNAYGVYGFSSSVSSNTNTYGGLFSSRREGGTNSLGYGIYATTYHNTSGATGASYGGYFGALGLGIGTKTGVFSKVEHLGSVQATDAKGVHTDIAGAYSSGIIGFHATITPEISDAGNTTGIYGVKLDMAGTGRGDWYGVRANVKGGTGNSPMYRYGLYADVEGPTWNYSYGVYARAKNVSDNPAGSGLRTYGGYFEATGSSLIQYGIYATSDANLGPNIRYAGYFAGNVSVTGNLTKGSGTFKIDHPQDPENKFLYHSFVESPDMKNIYDGVITTDANGEATVEMPAYFEALNKDFRYQLTGIGQFAQAIVADEINHNRFKIKTDKPNVKVSWQVTGIRKDAYAEANRVVVEVEKQGEEKGKYLHPEVFGKDKMQGIGSLHEVKAMNR